MEAYVCESVRTAIGRYGGSLANVRADDLAAVPLQALMERCPQVDWGRVDDVILGCANQAGEDNRNVARMALLLAGFPESVPGTTINRLCGSGLDAVAFAARAIRAGEAGLIVAGGVESMSRAPFVVGKATAAFSRDLDIEDTTIGWRFVNPRMKSRYGVESMPLTAENVAERFHVTREDQDAFALNSQRKTASAQASGRFADEIVATLVPSGKNGTRPFDRDEHPRVDTTLEKLAGLTTPFRQGGTITSGNASGVNDGACAMLVANEGAAGQSGLRPRARVVATAAVGVEPRYMGIGPVPATRKVLDMTRLRLEDMDVIEINEAFAAQALAVMRQLGLRDDDPRVNPNGGAIALGHPLGMSGSRLVMTAIRELEERKARYALCTMCIGVGQGIAMVLERV